VVPAFLDQALRGEPMTVFGSGSQTRSFCYVSDLVDGLYRLMLSEERYPVNLGNPREMTILEFAEHIRRMTGSKSEIVFRDLPEDDPKQRQPDITKARTLLGWEPRVPLDEGLRRNRRLFPRTRRYRRLSGQVGFLLFRVAPVPTCQRLRPTLLFAPGMK